MSVVRLNTTSPEELRSVCFFRRNRGSILSTKENCFWKYRGILFTAPPDRSYQYGQCGSFLAAVQALEKTLTARPLPTFSAMQWWCWLCYLRSLARVTHQEDTKSEAPLVVQER